MCHCFKEFLHSPIKFEYFLNNCCWPPHGTITRKKNSLWVNLEVMTMKGYYTFLRALEPFHLMQLSVHPRRPMCFVGVGLEPLRRYNEDILSLIDRVASSWMSRETMLYTVTHIYQVVFLASLVNKMVMLTSISQWVMVLPLDEADLFQNPRNFPNPFSSFFICHPLKTISFFGWAEKFSAPLIYRF